MKKLYENPKLQITLLGQTDIIVTSDGVLPPDFDDETGGDFAIFG